MDTDRKIAFSIAGGILLAVAAIAALTISTSQDVQDMAPARAAVVVTDPTAPAPVTEPISFPSPTATEIAEPQAHSAGTPEEAESFQVEPGVNYLARGLEAYGERNWDHAVAYLLAETDEHPERPYSRYVLGLALWKAGRLDEASQAMQRAAELDGSTIKAFVNLSRIENDRDEYDAALEAARAGLALNPDDATALFLEGRSLHNLGETGEAVASLDRSLAVDPDNGFVWNLLGLVRLQAQQDDEALAALERAVDLESEVAYIQNNLGMALERSGRRDEAVAAYRRAAELDPDHTNASRNLARLDPPAPEVPVESPEAIAQTDGNPTEEEVN